MKAIKQPFSWESRKGEMEAEDDLNRNNVEEAMIFGKHQVMMHEVYLLFVINKFLAVLAALS